MFSSIGDILPRFRIYERLFSNHELLTQALSKVFVDIISFCTEAKRVFRDGQRATSKSCEQVCPETMQTNWIRFKDCFQIGLETVRATVRWPD